ncbi:Uncharacterized protein TPAR_06807 [Tolypocladium paradoxum]|uniref:Endonuclease/exonuclease/phosphatase domain-containing protein n=1 Tax=Tolypocladium paradoxum TaxID=94208 RepID=A0A2S4KS41_9HYPO|nr:Uncharacterized protein TPAR_06807 [Tolypocladium paradoxum]
MHLNAFIPAALAGLIFGAAPAAAAAAEPRAAGSLSLANAEPPFTFKYSTPSPDPKNWVGVYAAAGGGPDDEKYVSDSLACAYAPQDSGTVQVLATKLQPGKYKAFFLVKDGYKWLAEPIEVVVPGGVAPISFLVERFTTHNARMGDKFEASLRGLLANLPGAKTQFAKTVGADWVTVSDDGVLSGVPSASGETQVTIQATASTGTKAQLQVIVPVRNSGSHLVDKLSVLTFNLWHGGTHISNFHQKQIRFLVESGVDIVGIQEGWGGHGTRIANALGWYVWQQAELAIVSRYPIIEAYPQAQRSGSVRIALDGADYQVIVWNAHLGHDPYGPYDFCFSNMSWDQVFKREAQSGRTPQIVEIVGRMKAQIANAANVPVILTGDFNAPSHLDWTNATRSLHCNVGDVPWPTSEEPTKAGLIDSFRAVNRDPRAVPGNTWSPIHLRNEGRDEPMDRIDFIYHKGLWVLSSDVQVVGKPKPKPDHEENEWTSDHAAVKTVFKVVSKEYVKRRSSL